MATSERVIDSVTNRESNAWSYPDLIAETDSESGTRCDNRQPITNPQPLDVRGHTRGSATITNCQPITDGHAKSIGGGSNISGESARHQCGRSRSETGL